MRRGRGRILYPEVSASRRVARLGVKGALLWTWLLPHCDDQGRIAGDALKERLVPHFEEVTAEDVETALQAMERERLIIRYRGAGQQLTQIADWWKWQARLTYKRPSYHPAPEGWRDRVTARLALGGYVARLSDGYGIEVLCTNCGCVVAPRAHGRGWVCSECDVELLGTRSPRPKVGGMQTRRTGKARELVLAALAGGPKTKEQLAAATGYSESSIGTLLPVLRRSGEVLRVSRRRPWTYRLKGSRNKSAINEGSLPSVPR